MRCPKCGYISFDHLEECLKCKKNIKATATALNGSIYQVAAPTFLYIQNDSSQDSEEPDDLFAEDLVVDGEDYIDEELEILVDSPDADFDADGPEIKIDDEEAVDVELDDGDETELEFKVDEADDDEIEIDLSQFEDTPSSDMALTDEKESEEPGTFGGFDVPDELADISDLAPPAVESEAEVVEEQEESDLNLDDLDFDLALDDLDTIGSRPEQEQVLSLDEIDFADTLAETQPLKSSRGATISMDDDLDFELDLGDLSIDKDL